LTTAEWSEISHSRARDDHRSHSRSLFGAGTHRTGHRFESQQQANEKESR